MTRNSTYRAGAALGLGTGLFLLWGVLALGVIGSEGDRADLMYLGVLSVGVGGAIVARGNAEQLATAMTATAGAQALVTVIALLMGKHNDPATSVPELVGLNAMFITMFLGSAWLFRRAANQDFTTTASAEQ